MTRPIVLASASPRRRELLSALCPAFDVVPSDIPEPMTGDPRADAIALARAKATAVAESCPDTIVIAADTIVYEGVRAYGKPVDPADAIAMWQALRGRQHAVVTAVAVAADSTIIDGWSEARVTLADLDDEAIERYVATGSPLDKAGAYAIQDVRVPTVAGLEGCYCCVVGLPLWRLRTALAALGVQAPTPDAVFERCVSCPERDVTVGG